MFAGVVAASWFALLAAAPSPQKIVGYYPNWGVYSGFTWKQVDYSQLTHVAWSFAGADSLTGAMLGPEDEEQSADLDSLVKAAHAHGVKALVSVGGGTGSVTFPPMARDASRRTRFCREVAAFVRERGFDGVDMDWEWMSQDVLGDTANYSRLVRELRDSLGPDRILSAAWPASSWTGKFFDVALAGVLDWIGVMTYDMTGDWDSQSRYNSPLFKNPRKVAGKTVADWSVAASMDYWSRTRGVPKDKLLFGQPQYGFVFSGATSPGATYSGSATYSDYQSIVAALPTWTLHWDDTAKANWATTPDGEYVTWDDPRTAAMKARWAKENGYAGAIVWELSQDLAGDGSHPMMDSLSRILRSESVGVGNAARPTLVLSVRGNELFLPVEPGAGNRLELFAPDGRLLRAAESVEGGLGLRLDGIRPGLAIARLRTSAVESAQPVVVPSRN